VAGFLPLAYLGLLDCGGWAGLQARLSAVATVQGFEPGAWSSVWRYLGRAFLTERKRARPAELPHGLLLDLADPFGQLKKFKFVVEVIIPGIPPGILMEPFTYIPSVKTEISDFASDFLGRPDGIGNLRLVNIAKPHLKIAQELNDSVTIAGIYNHTGILMQQVGRIEKALEYYNEALSIYEKYNIEEGTRLEVVDTAEGILFKPAKSILT
jgi:tetratricopeptide (TPR) repeat protein